MIECRGLVHIYKSADIEAVALQGLDMSIERGEIVAIVGASGSGKTTLMNVLAAVDRPSAGQATVAGRNLIELTESERDAYRREAVGYVWQQASRNFMPELTVEENLHLPMLATGASRSQRTEPAAERLHEFGVEPRRRTLPAVLSGGEQRLVPLAVALAQCPQRGVAR